MNLEPIKSTLSTLSTGDFLEKSKNLLATIGYSSERTLELTGTIQEFFDEFPAQNQNTKSEQAFQESATSIKLIFQFTKDEIDDSPQQLNLLESSAFEKGNYQSFLFCAVELKEHDYSRTKYAEFTREINKRLFAPTVILFRAGNRLTIAFADRRPNLINEQYDVLGQVTLIKDIHIDNPHRAHLDILSELSLEACIKWIEDNRRQKNFDGLLAAWLAKLDTEELNKKFYRRLFAWFEWVVEDEDVKFPTNENRIIKREEHVIRLITRLLFIWFIKEKGLVADALFNKKLIPDLLTEDDFENGDSYYRAVLQNLFFATLNTEIDKRKFTTGGNRNHRNFSLYRYKDQMQDPDRLLELFAKTPFINGGLFDCLDSFDATRGGGYRIDCFSDNQDNPLSIPNRLFFDKDQGLIPLLEHYKFTVEENTPIDQEVALDPELLGRVFENLLAAINPETGETARKMTGSYYTPRTIVDYMVDEALIASLSHKCQSSDRNTEHWENRLRYLLDYSHNYDDPEQTLDNNEAGQVVHAISELAILDPAVGSGAFPMGILHKLTLALRRLDPDNNRWETLQKTLASKRAAAAFDTKDDTERREELHEIDDTFKRYRDSNFGRKLYLIQNSIFGVDIQPIACQIAKLRFFISLAIEQEPDTDADNFGIKPLPNLETRFVAADTLIGLKEQTTLRSDRAVQLERELHRNRERYFHAKTRTQKRKCKEDEQRIRADIIAELTQFGLPEDDARKIAEWDIYDQNDSADWFDPNWMFGVTDGFDVVIGNPPYIQLQKDNGRLADLYQDVGFDAFTRMGDIYCLFYEKGTELLHNEGNLCFITSNKWMRAGYGEKLRDFFVKHTRPIQLLDMGPDVFDATVDTNILLLQNGAPWATVSLDAVTIGHDFDRQTGNISQYLNEHGVIMSTPDEGEPWAILSSTEMDLKRKIEEVGTRLKDWDIEIYRGIVTGCNEAFIIDEAKREELIQQDPRSAEIIKPLLRGKDIKRYSVQQSGYYILATGYDLDIPNLYPAVYNHLESVGEQIESGEIRTRGRGLYNRDDQGENWWNLRACAYYSEFEKEKVVWKRIGSILRFAYIQHRMYCLDSTCIAIGKYVKLLTGVLNSPVGHYQLFTHAPKTGTGDLIVSVQAVEPVLVPPITEANQNLATEIENKIDEIFEATAENPDADTSNLEDEIDKLVYDLYGLDEDEIAIVEGSV